MASNQRLAEVVGNAALRGECVVCITFRVEQNHPLLTVTLVCHRRHGSNTAPTDTAATQPPTIASWATAAVVRHVHNPQPRRWRSQ